MCNTPPLPKKSIKPNNDKRRPPSIPLKLATVGCMDLEPHLSNGCKIRWNHRFCAKIQMALSSPFLCLQDINLDSHSNSSVIESLLDQVFASLRDKKNNILFINEYLAAVQTSISFYILRQNLKPPQLILTAPLRLLPKLSL